MDQTGEEARELEALLAELQCKDGQEDAALSVMNDLANLRLLQGKTEEGAQLFEQIAQLRKGQLQASAAEAANSAPQPVVPQAGGVEGEEEDSWENWDAPTEPQAPSANQLPSNGQTSRQQGRSGKDSFPLTGAPIAKQSRNAPAASSRNKKEEEDSGGEGDSEPAGVKWEGGFDHCIELYNLTPDIKTGDLQEMLDQALPGAKLQPRIQWADDSHAVYVCESVGAARALMATLNEMGFGSVRPWEEASQASKQLDVAKLLPPKPRPRTTTAVARRLLTHALGVDVRDRGAEAALRAEKQSKLKERRAQREGAQAAWD